MLALRAVRVDHLAPVVAGLALPFGEHVVADLAQVRHQLVGGHDDRHALRLELVQVPVVLLRGELPAPCFGVCSGLEHRRLRGLVERVERLLVDDDGILRNPRPRVVEVLDGLVGLGIEAGRAGGHHRVDDARRERLRHLGRLHRDRLRADELGDLRCRRAVRAPLESLHVGARGERAVGENTLRRPRHRVQELDPLLREAIVERLLRRLVELERCVVGRREERNPVDAVQRILVLEVDEQDFARLRLSALHRTLDLGRLEQRRIRMYGDLELAAGASLDVGNELLDVLGVEVGRRIRGRQVPFDLRRDRGRQRGDGERHQQHAKAVHRESPERSRKRGQRRRRGALRAFYHTLRRAWAAGTGIRPRYHTRMTAQRAMTDHLP